MTDVIEVEIIMKLHLPARTTRPLHVAVSGAGAARAVAGELEVAFALTPRPSIDENPWILLARIASEGARTQAGKYG